MADTMMTFQNNNLCTFMTKEEIMAKAPYIYAKEKTNPNVSAKYTFASTETIIDDMEKLGWGVVDCKQQRANKRSHIRSFHMVAFQNPNVYIAKDTENGEVVDCYPRIILTNSHDGFHSFKFMIGLFRLVCSNGLIVATDTFANIAVRHANYEFEELRKLVASAIQEVGAQVTVMNEMENTTLNDEQKRSLAVEALRIRKGVKADEKFTVDDDTINDVLTPTRDEDKKNDLWTIFNVLQEKMMTGNYQMISPKNGKKRKARAIKGLAKDLSLNQQLFHVATSYRMAA